MVRLILIAVFVAFSVTEASAGWMDRLKSTVNDATSGVDSSSSRLTTGEIAQGLQDALRVGAQTVSSQLGAVDGFNGDPAVHIPLPPSLKSVQSTLKKIGMSSLVDEVELKLNRGAEAAMPAAKDILWKAITAMTLQDVRGIYNGPKDAATQYFKRVSTGDLTKTLNPIIDGTLNDVGAIQAYDTMMGSYKSMPFVPDVKANLTDHATKLALDGIFHYLAQEEAAIRANPVKRTTEILKKVFGAK